MDLKQLFKQCMQEVLEAPDFNLSTIESYFSPEYQQHVDGKTLNYEEFIAHIKHVKEVVQTAKLTFEKLTVVDSVVSSIHVVDVVKKDGGKAKFRVHGDFTFDNNRLIKTDERTEMLSGHESDEDLGSR